MPYIKQCFRENFDQYIDELCPSSAGDLNYIFTTLCHNYLLEVGLNYKNINEVIGALECAKLELYRRIAVPYEDKKIQENGDVNCLV
jgi:hypothetical protein